MPKVFSITAYNPRTQILPSPPLTKTGGPEARRFFISSTQQIHLGLYQKAIKRLLFVILSVAKNLSF
jgi:hypothetical protein